MSIRSTLLALLLSAPVPLLATAQPPGMDDEERELLEQFDADNSGWLDNDERKQAREFLKENPSPRRGFGGPPGGPGGPPGGPGGFGPGGFGGFGFGPPPEVGRGQRGGFGPPAGREPGGFGPPAGGPPEGAGPGDRGRGGPGRRGPGGPGGGNRPAATEGAKIDKASVTPLENDLYDTSALRTIFIDFENADWESELEDFHGTDVDVAATLTVDGKTFPNCGIHFRGKSSYGMVPAGYKRSLNVSTDMVDDDQRLLGYTTLNLLNGSSDDSMMSSVLYSHIARQYIPAPKANFVQVVINGENWGVYTNAQQFNKDFLRENFGSDKGALWKVSGSPRGGGGLEYRGEDPANYQHPYEQKSGGKKSLAKLIELCRVLEETPTGELPAALEPICDVDGLLWFLALDNGLINSDGYWIRASDYSIYLDEEDKFHIIPHDMNEAFRGAGGPGMRRGPATNSPVELDPLVGLDDPSQPLRSKVLAVPQYREQYMSNIRQLAEESLDWSSLGPFVQQTATLIDAAVKAETRKLGSYEAFVEATSDSTASTALPAMRGGHGSMNLKAFTQLRREYLLSK